MMLQSRLTVFAAIGGLLAMMGGIVYYASLDNVSLESIEFLSGDVRVVSVDTVGDRAKIETVFEIRNPSDTTFTVPGISYDLSTNGEYVVSGEYSTADIAMPGRVVFSTNEVIPIKSITYLIKTQDNAAMYDRLVAGEIDEYKASGMVIVESAWSIVELDFEVPLSTQT